jgi:transcriptional regulator with XRE-family HTH domain
LSPKRDTQELQQSIAAVGEQIRVRRVAKNLSQSELAQLVQTRQPVISRIEKGTHVPTWRNLERIAKVLDARVEVGVVSDEPVSV